MLAVNQGCAGWAMRKDLIVNVGAGVHANRRCLEQPYGPKGQQVRRSWACPDEMNSHSMSLITLHCTTGRAGRQP
jgi:hypothetical protein